MSRACPSDLDLSDLWCSDLLWWWCLCSDLFWWWFLCSDLSMLGTITYKIKFKFSMSTPFLLNFIFNPLNFSKLDVGLNIFIYTTTSTHLICYLCRLNLLDIILPKLELAESLSVAAVFGGFVQWLTRFLRVGGWQRLLSCSGDLQVGMWQRLLSYSGGRLRWNSPQLRSWPPHSLLNQNRQ